MNMHNIIFIRFHMNKNYMIALTKDAPVRYLTMSTTSGESRLMCFEKRHTATSCRNYMVAYKTEFGKWPLLDMRLNESSFVKNSSKKTQNEVLQEIFIDEKNDKQIEYMCGFKNLNVLICNSFDVQVSGQKHDIQFSGVEFLNSNDDMFSYVQ